jgi:hypothetical protein
MWVYEHAAETAASSAAVWHVLRNLDEWGAWDTSLEWARPLSQGHEWPRRATRRKEGDPP